MWFRRPPSRDALDALGMSVEDACSHLFLVGTTGSGKSSILRIVMQAMLQRAVSVVWSCVKNGEADEAQKIIRSTIFRDRLLRLTPGHFTFNFVSYELFREGGSVDTLCRLFERLNSMMNRSKKGGANESFWENLFGDFMRAAVTIAKLIHRERITVAHIHTIILNAPSSVAELRSPGYAQSKFMTWLRTAQDRAQGDSEERELAIASEFFLMKQTQIGEEARGAALQQCTSLLGPFLRSPMFETVCAEESTFTPDMPLNYVCCILDFPILVYLQAGQLFQALINMMVMEAALRRKNPETYCAIVRDEFQFLCPDPEFEMMVQSVARSHKLMMVSACQNIPMITAAFGGGPDAEQQMKALLGCYSAKLILANICDVTNRLFSETFGQFKDQFVSLSENEREPESLTDVLFGNQRFHFSTSENLDYRIPPETFLSLRRGGPSNDFLIDAVFSMGGHTFETGLPFKFVTFSQR